MKTSLFAISSRLLLTVACSLGWGAQLACAENGMDYNSPAGTTTNVFPASGTTNAPVTGGSKANATGGKMGASLLASKPTDAQIMKITQAINNNEIDAAKMAEKQASSRDVKSFALEMENEHTRMNSEGDMLGKKLKMAPEESAMSVEIKIMGKADAVQLKMASRENFDKTYIDQQATGHEKVLGIFDTALLPNAKNPELKANLEAARKHVAEHLSHAQKVQYSLTKGASAK